MQTLSRPLHQLNLAVLLIGAVVSHASFSQQLEPSGLIFEIDSNVPVEEVDKIKAGIDSARIYLRDFLGGDIPESLRKSIVVKIVATGLGNQEPGGGGSCCTAFSGGQPRLFFDVLHSDWLSSGNRQQHGAAHEYIHVWQASLGCISHFDQRMGAWLNEGMAEIVSFEAQIHSGTLQRGEVDEFTRSWGFESGQLDVPLRSFQAVTSPIWPGQAGHLALEQLVALAPSGKHSLRLICENVALGQSVPTAFENAFCIGREEFYQQYQPPLPELQPSPGDSDGDGVQDVADNCPSTPNPSQSDSDGDGLGAACDGDLDNDGVPNDIDAFVWNAEWTKDTDHDAIGDRGDNDDDGDGIPDSQDPDPLNYVSDFRDNDTDGEGDACDEDDDNDGMLDTFEIANGLDPLTPVDASEDLDGDGFTNLQEFLAGTDPNDPASNSATAILPILQLLTEE